MHTNACRPAPPFGVPRLRGFSKADLSAVRGTRALEPRRLKPAGELLVNEELRTCRVEPPFEIGIEIEIENCRWRPNTALGPSQKGGNNMLIMVYAA